MLKKLLLLLMVFVLVMPAAYAEGENTILRYAVELGRKLDALAEDEAYFAPYDLDEGIMNYICAYGEGDHDRPIRVVGFDLNEYIERLDEAEDIPEAALRQVLNRTPAQLIQALATSYGGDPIILPSVLRAGVTFAAPNVKGREVWVLQYENAASIAVGWYAENDAVHMQAMFLPEGSMDGDDLPFTLRVIASARPALDEHALALANELRILAANEKYLDMLNLADNIRPVVRGYVSEDEQPRMTLCALTDNAYEAQGQLIQQIGYLSDVSVAAVAAMQTNVIFADTEASGTGMYLFLYEEGVPVIVQWRGENGAYYLNAAFQPGEMPFGCRSAEDASAWAESIGLTLNFQPLGAMLLP